jgi:hypothetical protein
MIRSGNGDEHAISGTSAHATACFRTWITGFFRRKSGPDSTVHRAGTGTCLKMVFMQVGVRRETPNPNVGRLGVGLAESIPGLRPAGQPAAGQGSRPGCNGIRCARSAARTDVKSVRDHSASPRRFCRCAHPNLHVASGIARRHQRTDLRFARRVGVAVHGSSGHGRSGDIADVLNVHRRR